MDFVSLFVGVEHPNANDISNAIAYIKSTINKF